MAENKKILDWKQERAELVTGIRNIMNEYEGKEEPAEKKAEREKMEARFDELSAKIIREERQLERERELGETPPGDDPKDQGKLLFAKALSGNQAAVEEYKRSPGYRNAQTLGTDSQAGALTAPMHFVEELIKGLDDELVVRQLARKVGPIGPAQSLGYPYMTSRATAMTFIGENEESVEETTMAFGRREFKPNRGSKIIKVSRSLLNHAPMAEGVVREEMQRSIGAGLENAYMTGTGTGEPLGLFVASAQGINTDRDVSDGNTATGLTFDGLTNAKYAIKQQYRRRASWIFSREAIKQAAKLKDGNDQYIWQPSVALNTPDTILGIPAYESENVPNTFTTGNYVGMVADFSELYWYTDADALTIQLLLEKYAEYNLTGILYEYFGDGAPVLPEACARIKLA